MYKYTDKSGYPTPKGSPSPRHSKVKHGGVLFCHISSLSISSVSYESTGYYQCISVPHNKVMKRID